VINHHSKIFLQAIGRSYTEWREDTGKLMPDQFDAAFFSEMADRVVIKLRMAGASGYEVW
jgi:hypothetical protein